ncbi:MAG TPA: carboxypeptidase-like regulatory domain-containing protein [Acidobacteriaceae bacterium]|jgi:hypothetical protein|nr:carboxypeptidase-like regulatory domain-containing protein [Acidobacteriaceae bacterium]
MKRQVLIAIFSAIAIMLFFSPGTSVAQQATTSLSGTVMDTSGAVVPGAVVTIARAATGQSLKTTSDARGQYQFQQLAPGTWTVTISATGFGDQTKIGELLVSNPATIDFKMSLQAVAQTVNVTSETATLNTSDATLGNAMDNSTIKSLPMEDRNVPDLLSLQPGVLYLGHNVDAGPGSGDTDSRTGAVNGVRSDQGNVTMDGMDDNDQLFGYAFTGVLRETLDSVEEFRVTTGMANTDQGRSAGAQINLVTKSGTNQFHGGLYEYNRNTDTAANDWFNKQQQLAAGEANVPGEYIRNTYGGDVGGPIKKKKFFFFGNYEASHTRENAQVLRTTPFQSFKNGDLTYLSNNAPITLTPAQIKTMDPNCTALGTCPLGNGVNPAIMTVMNQYPTANGTAAGDGYNFGSYTFSSPNPVNLNTTIVRLDWYPSDRQQIFVRGNLQDDTTDGILYYPGQPPSYTLRDNTKGIAAGDTWTITNNLVNDFRYGLTRQGYADAGQDCGAYVTFSGISQPTSENCTSIVHVPVQNFIDNLTWTHGNHTLSFGGDLRIITNYQSTNANSYSAAQVYNQWLTGSNQNLAGWGGSLDPSAFGFPAVDNSFQSNYNNAATIITGLVPQVSGQFNFHVQPGGKTGNALAEGAPVALNYLSHEVEYYIQDAWRAQPNLTFTFGIRQVFLQPPYETHGQQLQPTTDTHQWFVNRATQATLGITDQPDLSFAPSGKANNAQPYWNMQWNNIAPRVAMAWAVNNKTSVRAGVGMFYDHFGEGIVDTFAKRGSFGLQTQIRNPDGQYTIDNAPRFSGISNLPPLKGVTIPSIVQYPFTPPNNVNTGLALAWGVDNRIKTPYSIATDFSVQRELSHGYSIEADYIGTFGRHLLQQLDLAEPLDLVDPQSGMDYFTAGTLLAKATYANQSTVAPIPYWENLFPYLKTNTMSATQNIYSNVYRSLATVANDSYALAVLDAYCAQSEGGLGCGPYAQPNGNVKTRYYQRQFSGLYAWSSIGLSSYNALQLTLRKVTNVGLAFNFSYTYGNSIDMGSDAERASSFSTGSFSEIINSFDPGLNRGLSDFDVRHLISGNFVYQLPFGRGQRFAGNANHLTDALIGGWGLSGITRWSSGLPFSIYPPLAYPTNFVYTSNAVVTAPIKMHRHLLNGLPEAFADPSLVNNGLAAGTPIRFPYPGEAGSRNPFRGDGYFEQDGSLSKVWRTYRTQTLRFAWEVFNVSNSSRFDTNPISSLGGLNNIVSGGPAFGIYSHQLVQSRKQQFSFRYDF